MIYKRQSGNLQNDTRSMALRDIQEDAGPLSQGQNVVLKTHRGQRTALTHICYRPLKL